MKYEIVGGTGIAPTVAILCPTIQTKEIVWGGQAKKSSDCSAVTSKRTNNNQG